MTHFRILEEHWVLAGSGRTGSRDQNQRFNKRIRIRKQQLLLSLNQGEQQQTSFGLWSQPALVLDISRSRLSKAKKRHCSSPNQQQQQRRPHCSPEEETEPWGHSLSQEVPHKPPYVLRCGDRHLVGRVQFAGAVLSEERHGHKHTPGETERNRTQLGGAGGDKGEEKAREETEHKMKSYRETGGYGMAVQKANC